MVVLAPLSTTLVSAAIVDIAHEVDSVEDESAMGYFLLQRFRIDESSDLRLRISLLHMPKSSIKALNTSGGTPELPGVINSGSVVTRVMRGHAGATEPRFGQSPFVIETRLLLYSDMLDGS